MLLSQSLPSESRMFATIFKSNSSPIGAGSSSRTRNSIPGNQNDSRVGMHKNSDSYSVDNERSMSTGSGIPFKPELINTTPEPPTDDYVQKTKKTAGYLRLLLHSTKCGGACGKTACLKTSTVVEHINQCGTEHCDFAGCQTSKKLLSHYDSCGKVHVCSPSEVRGSSGYSTFCLMCSLVQTATTSPTNKFSYKSPEPGIYNHNNHEDHDRYAEIYSDNNERRSMYEDTDVQFVIFDEVMQFNKVPFQEVPQEYYRHSIASDAPISTYNDEPPRKIRSKSLNAACIDEMRVG